MPLDSPARSQFDAPAQNNHLNLLTLETEGLKRNSALLSTKNESSSLSSATHGLGHNKSKSYLNAFVNSMTSQVLSDGQLKDEVNHYGCEFLKTASLFAGGKVGLVSTVLTYGADQAKTEGPWQHQVTDFALGGLKGGTMKGMFSLIGANMNFAPTKGAFMGLTARTTDVMFTREAINDPDAAINRLNRESNKYVMLMDAGLFMAGEGVFQSFNYASKGALQQNRMLSGMVMGGSFGFVNGSFGEATRQFNSGQIDPVKIALRGGLDAGVGALGAGFGMKVSDPAFQAKVGRTVGDAMEAVGLNPSRTNREFIVTGGMTELKKFTNEELAHTVATVKEVKRFLGWERVGPEKQVLVAHTDQVGKDLPVPKIADYIATCNPEKFGAPVRSSHLFPNARGPVFMELGSQSRMRMSVGDKAATPWQYSNGGPRTRLGGPEISINVMAPLMVGNPDNVHDPARKHEWESFEHQLGEAKKLGVNGVSTDVWWGITEPKPGEYRWGYYDHISTKIIGAGLKWVPILSFHQCGGNVGDTVNVNVPTWVWADVAKRMGSTNPDAAKYVSEHGNVNSEFVQAWSTDHAIPLYSRYMNAFKTQFAGKAHAIPEINISLGPAGEARYPSYNAHDQNTGWPHRGALQCYSEAAKADFKRWSIERHGDEAGVLKAWGEHYGKEIGPPKDVDAFYRNNDHHNTQYGRDFFDWYNQSLVHHGKKMLRTGFEVFGPGTPFQHSEIGFKLPGVHWQMGWQQDGQIVISNRLPELNAGLIRTTPFESNGKDSPNGKVSPPSEGNDWHSDDKGRGYRHTIRGYADLMKEKGGDKLVLHFTCLEMRDGVDGSKANSLPYSLATWVGREAKLAGLPLKGENALGWGLPYADAWHSMASHLDMPGQNGHYKGLTLLRLSDVLGNDVSRWHVNRLTDVLKTIPAQKASGQ
jgi:beta-amylase